MAESFWRKSWRSGARLWRSTKFCIDFRNRYKEVFSLRTFGELKFSEIGMLFGKSENWARVTYYRARVKIREELEQ